MREFCNRSGVPWPLRRLSTALLFALMSCSPMPAHVQEAGAYWRHSRPATDLPIHIYVTSRGPAGCEQYAGCSIGPRWTLKGLAWILWVHPQRGYSAACTERHELLHAFGWTHDDTRRPMTTEAEVCGFHVPLPQGATILRFHEEYV